MTDFGDVIFSAKNEVLESNSIESLEKIKVKYFGKNGLINNEMKKLSSLDAEGKQTIGKQLNLFKREFSELILERKDFFRKKEIENKIKAEFSDPTMPTRQNILNLGRVHPITQTIEEIVSILGSMGLRYVEGPDVEDDFHNFTALNIPENHPAREMHDTFYISSKEDKKNVLRTHTSPVQIRSLKDSNLPIKIFAPGRTYRCDSDITHTPMFHQVEGLIVDKDISFSNLKWFITQFCNIFFNKKDLKLRFRPSFFPFTEPSAEVDINCFRKNNKIYLGEGNDWMEILGCGMVHPNVIKACNLENKETSGFAFGVGIERLCMLKYGMPDLRDFFDNDLRWLNHYGFSFFNYPDLNWE